MNIFQQVSQFIAAILVFLWTYPLVALVAFIIIAALIDPFLIAFAAVIGAIYVAIVYFHPH